MNTAIKRALLEKIKQYRKIIISRHLRPDGDAVGSTLGLQRMLKLTYPEKEGASLPRQQNRGKYLNDAALEQAYAEYLRLYSSVPRTLCHDDLLPFNVLCANGHATIIDWEYAAILPYPTSLARLIAHGEEDESAFFYMTQADKDYAIEYYFEHLLKENGIDYNDYRRTLDYFLLYEYCEWIMLGVKCNETGSERFQKYYAKAKEHIKTLA